jgi:hypothetical protein
MQILCKGVTTMQNEWVSVKDRLPEKDGMYLCLYRNDDYPYNLYHCICDYANNLQSADYGAFQGIERNGFYDFGWVEEEREEMYYEVSNIEYWMPLPELPKGE